MKSHTIFIACGAALMLAACASTTNQNISGSNRSQLLLVSADKVQQMSLQYYAEQNAEARKKNELITSGVEFNRVAGIMRRLKPQVAVFRQDAQQWPWELVLIDEPTINAHVMAGGKVTFYTGLIRKLNLSDDEIAAVMGHEMAHALREHTREKISQGQATDLALQIGGALLGFGQTTMQLAGLAKQVGLDLPFSRGMESEADVYGLELAARAGYDPRAAITLWDKMGADIGSRPPQWMSTHPSPENRKAELHALMPKVLPLYEAAQRVR